MSLSAATKFIPAFSAHRQFARQPMQAPILGRLYLRSKKPIPILKLAAHPDTVRVNTYRSLTTQPPSSLRSLANRQRIGSDARQAGPFCPFGPCLPNSIGRDGRDAISRPFVFCRQKRVSRQKAVRDRIRVALVGVLAYLGGAAARGLFSNQAENTIEPAGQNRLLRLRRLGSRCGGNRGNPLQLFLEFTFLSQWWRR